MNKKDYFKMKTLKTKMLTRGFTNAVYKLKYAHEEDVDENMLEFMGLLLSFLEPMMARAGTTIFKQNERVGEIVFLIKGVFEVGYNHEFMVRSRGLSSSQIQQKNKNNTYSLYSRALKSFKKSFNLQNNPYQQFRFPLRLKPGQAIGFYQTMFEKQFKFIYRAEKEQDCHCFFIRKQNYKRVMQMSSNLSVT